MRRIEKKINDNKTMDNILNEAEVLRIALIENNIPYIIPMNFVHFDNCIYLHSATVGKKISIIKRNNNVCFETNIKNELVRSEQACGWSYKFQSIIGFGKAFIINNTEEKRKALIYLMEKYSKKENWDLPEESINNTAVIKISIDSMTGKSSGY